MPFDYVTTIPMVRQYNYLIDKTDPEIQSVLLNHAVPRIRMYLLSSRNPDGQYIFYVSLGDLADSSAANQAETLVDLVMDEQIVKASFQRIAAALSASWIMQSDPTSILGAQRDIATSLEKQAMDDLKHLIKSDLINRALDTARTTLVSSLSQLFYFANDYDVSSVDLDNKVAIAYSGAQQVGKATAIINGYAVEAPIAIGDTPGVIATKLALAINSAQAGNLVNVTAAPNEGPKVLVTRDYYYTNSVTGAEESIKISYPSHVASLQIIPWKYDLVVDYAVVTTSLTHTNGLVQDPGVDGIIYGNSSNTSYLTKLGPWSVAVDLNTGKSTTINPDDTSSNVISDSFYFTGETTVGGEITYRVNDYDVRTIQVPAAITSLEVVKLIAQDMTEVARTTHLIAAVRPSVKLSLNGTLMTAPGLTPVAFITEGLYSKIVMNIISVPDGIVFGVVPNNLLTQNYFDADSKSVVVTTVVKITSGVSSAIVDPANPDENYQGSRLYTHIPTSQLKAILDKTKDILL